MDDEEYKLLRQMVDETSYVFDHDDESNWTALFDILNHSDHVQRQQVQQLRDWKFIDNQSGKALDDTGKDYGVSRIDDNDDFYRFLIRLAKLKNHTDGSVDSLYRLIAYALQAEPNEFVIRFGYEVDGEPNALRIDDVPNSYNTDTRKTRLLMKYLEQSVAAGIRLVGMTFQEINQNNLYIGMVSTTMEEETNVMKTSYELDNFAKKFIGFNAVTQYEEINIMKRRNVE